MIGRTVQTTDNTTGATIKIGDTLTPLYLNIKPPIACFDMVNDIVELVGKGEDKTNKGISFTVPCKILKADSNLIEAKFSDEFFKSVIAGAYIVECHVQTAQGNGVFPTTGYFNLTIEDSLKETTE